ncbi:hypothetical protein BVRB_7g168350, partial [Beta vulgaris subsp. vulgaris]
HNHAAHLHTGSNLVYAKLLT